MRPCEKMLPSGLFLVFEAFHRQHTLHVCVSLSAMHALTRVHSRPGNNAGSDTGVPPRARGARGCRELAVCADLPPPAAAGGLLALCRPQSPVGAAVRLQLSGSPPGESHPPALSTVRGPCPASFRGQLRPSLGHQHIIRVCMTPSARANGCRATTRGT